MVAVRRGGNITGRIRAHAVVTALLLLALPSAASAVPCIVPDNGGGTITLPPAGCDYLSPNEVHLIIDGLPAGTTIELAPIHKDFICFEQGGVCTIPLPPGECEAPGGGLGGNGDCFGSTLELQVTGTGALAGFNRVLFVGVTTEIHTGPRVPGDPVQDFDNEMVQLQGQLFGDPDFDFLQIRAGSAFALPSPGHTTLTDLGGGNWNVDSFFDVFYEIDFAGAPGSVLEGLSGSTQATLRMETGEPASPPSNPCVVPDDGTGTVTLPPAGCEYLSPSEVHQIIDGLPPGTTIELAAIHKNFICGGNNPLCSAAIPPGSCEAAGGSLGGNVDCFQSDAELEIRGTGALGGFQRTIFIPLDVEVHTGPRNPGDSVQTFPNEMVQLQGEIFGDPDFCTLRMRAGSGFGLPSPGQTTLTDLGAGNWNVDSFFDVFYEIDFQGCPGSQLEGFAGTTSGQLRMETGEPAPHPCQVPDNGTGTVTLPPAGCEYLSPDEVHQIIDGLPPGTTIELDAIHKDFFCSNQRPWCSAALAPGTCEGVGGSLGGNVDCFDSTAELTIAGTGSLGGFQRTIFVPLRAEVHTGPRTPGAPIQTFPNEMVLLEGEIFGDPDFDFLLIRGGSNLGLPGPGFTRLTEVPGGEFTIDSFFDIDYQIDFQGAPGSVLDGLSDTTQGTIRMQVGDPSGLAPNQLPALSGPGLLLFGSLLALTGLFIALRRRDPVA